MSGHSLHARDCFLPGHMRKPRRTDDVTDGVDAGKARLVGGFINIPIVGLDVALDHLHLESVGEKSVASGR